MKKYISIGKLVAPHGTRGTMVLKHHLGKKTALSGLAVFFIEDLPGSFLPYFPVGLKARSESEILVDIDGVTTREKAHTLLQKQVWITEEDFSRFADVSAPISLLGFTILDKDQTLGEVLEVIEQPHQVLCRISYKGNDDILIPVNEASLVRMDRKNRKLILDLPDGLIDVQT